MSTDLNGRVMEVGRARDRRTDPLAIGELQVFRTWCLERGLRWMPASSQDVRTFFRDRLPSVGEVEMKALLRAIRRAHLRNAVPDPTQGAWRTEVVIGADSTSVSFGSNGAIRARKKLVRDVRLADGEGYETDARG